MKKSIKLFYLGIFLFISYQGQCLSAQESNELFKKTEKLFLLVEGVARQLPEIEGTLDDVEALLMEGIDPNAMVGTIDDGKVMALAPLHLATYFFHLDLIELLLNYGADPALESRSDGQEAHFQIRPLFMVTRRFDTMQAALVQQRAKPQELQETYQVLKLFIQHTDLEFSNPIDPISQFDILEWATRRGLPHIVKLAFERGAQLGQRNPPLILIAFELAKRIPFLSGAKKYLEVIEILLDHGDNPHVLDNIGANLLHLAAYFGDEALSRKLLYAGVSAFHFNEFGITPSVIASRRGHYKLSQLLKDAQMICPSQVM